MDMQTDLSPLAGGTCFKVIEHFVISRDSTTGKLDAPALLAWSKVVQHNCYGIRCMNILSES